MLKILLSTVKCSHHILAVSTILICAMIAAIKDVCSVVLRHGSVDIAEQMVQYNYEPVQGDQVLK